MMSELSLDSYQDLREQMLDFVKEYKESFGCVPVNEVFVSKEIQLICKKVDVLYEMRCDAIKEREVLTARIEALEGMKNESKT